jgi:hypothetical protein
MHGDFVPPLEQWTKWPIPNYDNPPTQSKYVLTLSCILGPITVSMLLGRLWVRVRMQRNAGLDDWLMLASLVRITSVSRETGVMLMLPGTTGCFDHHLSTTYVIPP